MTQYIYAVPEVEWTHQHLLETKNGPALCGFRGDWKGDWSFGRIPHHPIPGVALCEQCKLERNARKADARKADTRAAELRAEAAAIKTYWIQERKP
jgi:hypothetical protein